MKKILLSYLCQIRNRLKFMTFSTFFLCVLVLHNICEFIPHDDGYISNRNRGCVQGRDGDKINKTHWKKKLQRCQKIKLIRVFFFSPWMILTWFSSYFAGKKLVWNYCFLFTLIYDDDDDFFFILKVYENFSVQF